MPEKADFAPRMLKSVIDGEAHRADPVTVVTRVQIPLRASFCGESRGEHRVAWCSPPVSRTDGYERILNQGVERTE